ncbi:MAG: ABC transporter substrate-binding protein, partial [Bdellovibrionaceae bacterium]|nr:ABC transporter substrate-binding protein [Pseudobdellovibrionaceae bacterium]
MLPLLLCALVGSGYLWAETKTSNRPVFRLHLGQLPESEDPARVRSSSGNFLLQARHRGLLKYTSGKGLEPDIAKCHRPKPLELHCNIQDDQFWSDGSRITAKDVQNSLLRLLDMKVSAPRAHLLFPVRGAREYYSGAKSNPAIWARRESRIVFELLAGEDREFEYHLTHPALAVYSPDKKRFSGYYRDHKLSANKVQLIANPYLPGHESRPDIEFIVIPEDTVALKLFEKGDLDFLRRLPTLFLPQYRGRSELVEFPQVRMDYYGFGPALKENPWLRQLLSENIDFSSLQKLLGSGGLPGCFGLTEDLSLIHI